MGSGFGAWDECFGSESGPAWSGLWSLDELLEVNFTRVGSAVLY